MPCRHSSEALNYTLPRQRILARKACAPRGGTVAPTQIRAGFLSQSHRALHGGFLGWVRKHEDGLYLRMLRRAFEGKLDDATIRALKPRYHTDHLNSYLCDDPSNFFLLYGPLNIAFGFERLMGYKKKLAGDAWDGVVYFVKKAIEIEYGLYGSR